MTTSSMEWDVTLQIPFKLSTRWLVFILPQHMGKRWDGAGAEEWPMQGPIGHQIGYQWHLKSSGVEQVSGPREPQRPLGENSDVEPSIQAKDGKAFRVRFLLPNTLCHIS